MSYLKYEITADGDYPITGTAGEFIFQVAGTWDGATAKLQWVHADGSVDFVDGSFTADGGGRFDNATGHFNVNVASAGASTDLNAYLAPVVGRSRGLI